MTYAYRCPNCGLAFCDSPNPVICCGVECEPYEAGAPEPRPGAPSVFCMKERWSDVHKCMITSRRQEDALDDSRGIATVTEKEARDMSPPPDKSEGKIVSYGGQRKRSRRMYPTNATARL